MTHTYEYFTLSVDSLTRVELMGYNKASTHTYVNIITLATVGIPSQLE